MKKLVTALFTIAVASLASPVFAELRVVTSIKPVHSLVSGVMQGVSKPSLLIEGQASPHDYTLKPSQAKSLQNATHVFWIGHELEAFMEKPLATLGQNAVSVELLETEGLALFDFRSVDDDLHHDEAEHEHEEAGHEHGEEHAEAAHEGHHHEGQDPHIWLDPENAKIIVRVIETTLSASDTENSGIYKANADALIGKLDALKSEVETVLRPVQDRRFFVFHDAYQYFEKRFGITASGYLTVNPEVSPGASKVNSIRKKIKAENTACVFSEPQFNPAIVSVLTENTAASSGVLDPLGSAIPEGPEQYFTLIGTMADTISNCLAKNLN